MRLMLKVQVKASSLCFTEQRGQSSGAQGPAQVQLLFPTRGLRVPLRGSTAKSQAKFAKGINGPVQFCFTNPGDLQMGSGIWRV